MLLRFLTVGTSLLYTFAQQAVESTGDVHDLPDLSDLYDDAHYDDSFTIGDDRM
jgi:hypothetical protein